MRSKLRAFRKNALALFAPNALSIRHWKADVLAGTLVAVVAIPLALALAVASGVPPVYGLYTSIIAGIVVALFGGSELGVSGPAAAMAVLLYSVVQKFGLDGLLLAGFLAGLIQIGLGLSGIGRVVKFIPYTVVTGFTTGIGVLILIGQLGNLFGVDAKAEGIANQFAVLLSHLPQFNPLSLAVGLGTLLLIFLLPRLYTRAPASFAALVFFSGLAWLANLNIKMLGDVPSGLPPFAFFPLHPHLVNDLLPTAFAIALLASIESLLSSVAADGMTGTKHSSSKELVGQGLSNVVLPFFHGIPATGVIVRTATNIKNGAKTRLSSLVHSAVLLLVVLFFAPLAAHIPLAVLSGILIYTAIHLMAFDEFAYFLKDSESDTAVFVATVGATVFLELTSAILIGFTLAGLLFIRKMSENLDVRQVPSSQLPNPVPTLASDIAGVARTYRISGPLFFGSAYALEQIADETPEDPAPALVLDLLEVDYVDSSALNLLAGIVEKHRRQGPTYLAVKNQTIIRKILNSPVKDALSDDGLVSSVEDGLARARYWLHNRKG